MIKQLLIRKATVDDAAAIAKIHVQSWQVTYRGIVEDSYLQSLNWQNRIKIIGLISCR